MINCMNCPICHSNRIITKYKNDKTSLCRYGFMSSRSEALNVPKNLELQILECIDCDFAWNNKFESSKVNYADLPVLESALHSKSYLEYKPSKR